MNETKLDDLGLTDRCRYQLFESRRRRAGALEFNCDHRANTTSIHVALFAMVLLTAKGL